MSAIRSREPSANAPACGSARDRRAALADRCGPVHGSDVVLKNIVSTVKLAKTCGLPIVHSTVNVSSGRVKPTAPELADLLEESPPIDRTTLNAWEDADFLAAERAQDELASARGAHGGEEVGVLPRVESGSVERRAFRRAGPRARGRWALLGRTKR